MLRSHALAALTALCLSASALGCADAPSNGIDRGDDSLVDPNNSNIRSPDIGQVTQLKLLPNTNVPRAVLVSLTNSAASMKFVADLHEHIVAINEAEGLSGADGYSQQFNLIVAASSSWSYDTLLREIRRRRGLPPTAKVPLIDLVEDVSANDLWMQDFGEIAAVRGVNDSGQTWYGLLDAGRGREIDVRRLGSILGVPITRIPAPPSSGTYGGNTEATAEGTLYIGDRAPAQYLNGLRSLGNPDAIVLPSDWLVVGHVDEYVTVVPARNECNSALVVSSGLEALNMARRAPAEFDAVLRGIDAAIDAYAVNRRGADEDYALSDFDTSRQPRSAAEALVRQSVIAEHQANEAIARLGAGACVAQVIRVPQLFKDYRGRAVAATPGTVNSLILRSHAIVPDPFLPSLRTVVRQRFAEALGSESRVHFIDDLLYHEAFGEVHCGTNVIRELAMPYRM